MTNAGFLLPDPGFHEGLREVSRRHGTLLGIDETHTLVTAYGGLTTQWALEPDLLTVGKSIAGGVPLGAYGMTDDVAQVLRPPTGRGRGGRHRLRRGSHRRHAVRKRSVDGGRSRGTHRGADPGSVHRNGEARRTACDGSSRAHRRGRSPVVGDHHGSHAFYVFSPQPPRHARDSRAPDDPELRALIRLSLANRGIWESGWWLGPSASVAHTAQEADVYLATIGECLSQTLT